MITFDDDTLLPNGGLAVAALLTQRLGIGGLVDEHSPSPVRAEGPAAPKRPR